MKATQRARPAPRRKSAEPPSHRATDIWGIAVLSLAVLTALSLLLPNTGLVGGAIDTVFRTLFGRGAWATPFVLAIAGFGLLAGRKTLEVSHLTLGLFLLFMSFLGGLAQAANGDFFDLTIVASSGGYLGALIGWMFTSLFGAAKLVGVVALGLVGVVLCVNSPIRVMLLNAKDHAKSLRPDRADERKPLRERPSKTAVVHLPDREHEVAGSPEEMTAIEARRRPAVTVRDATPEFVTSSQPTPKEGYQLPPLTLLAEPASKPKRSASEMQANIETLEGTLEEFGIDANVVEVAAGPTVTRYEIQLGPGIRVARITALADNIAMNLAASHVRVEAPIPGKAAIGVEVPNSKPSPVSLREVCESKEFQDHPSRLAVSLGQDVSGVNKYADLTRMPHLLIGGATNSGKSIGLASIIMSLLVRNTPKDLKFVMIDPKRVELSLFEGVPHLICPVVKDVKEAPGVLRAVWREMDRRYDQFSERGVRNIDGWNETASFQERLPYIVVVIDELADLMIQAAAEVETSICRLAQLARATGIHLVIATQRPSVDVITGTIKANIASRIAYTVSSQIDSRTILDQKGAEALIGRGDMLFLPIDASKPLRVQGCYVSEREIQAVCTFWREQEKPAYSLQPIEVQGEKGSKSYGGDEDSGDDPLWEDTVRWVVDRGQASTSMLQRRFSIGFQRASRLLDEMEVRGIVGPRDGPRPRDVLVSPVDVDSMFGARAGGFGDSEE